MTLSIAPIVDADRLAAQLPHMTVADVRWYLDGRSGRQAYLSGHLPGAVFVDLDADLSAPPAPRQGRHPLPSPEAFAASMSRLGVGDHDPVVAYDDSGGSIAARLVWMLRALGHPAALLDGGLAAWTGPLSTEPATRPPSTFTPRPWPPRLLADADLVDRLRRQSGAVVLDARARERFRGDLEPLDPRPGHVPGARNAPWMGNLDPATGRFLDPEGLRARYSQLGAADVDEMVVYCGSGVTACHDLLAFESAGLGPARLFAGSWSAWSADPERPAALGD